MDADALAVETKDLARRFGNLVAVDHLDLGIPLTTRDMEEAEALCREVGIMHRGGIVALGSPAGLRIALGSATMADVFVHHTGGEGAQSA